MEIPLLTARLNIATLVTIINSEQESESACTGIRVEVHATDWSTPRQTRKTKQVKPDRCV
jgi:hypothetical protein